MLDSEAILAQADQGQIPETWQVFRARRPSSFWLATLSGLAILALLWIVLYVVTTLLPTFPLSITTLAATGALLITIAVTVIIALVVACLVAISAVRRAQTALLVVTPDGFVQRIRTAKPPVKAIPYADIADIKMNTSSAANTTRVFTSIEIEYPDGGTETWLPIPGPADEVTKLVIAGHARYAALHNPQPQVAPDAPMLVQEGQGDSESERADVERT